MRIALWQLPKESELAVISHDMDALHPSMDGSAIFRRFNFVRMSQLFRAMNLDSRISWDDRAVAQWLDPQIEFSACRIYENEFEKPAPKWKMCS